MPPAVDRTVYRAGGDQTIPRPRAWAHVDHPPPVHHPLDVITDDIAAVLAAEPKGRPAALNFDEARPSAVLVLLADGPGGAGVLLTRRSRAMRNHSGEVSFPGGRLDNDETPTEGALREANEEVGLDPAAVEIIGELDHVATVVSRSHVVPIVGRVATQLALAPASMELVRAFWVPLADLLRTDTYRVERWHFPPSERLLYFFELDDETVWGLTAFILTDLLRRLS